MSTGRFFSETRLGVAPPAGIRIPRAVRVRGSRLGQVGVAWVTDAGRYGMLMDGMWISLDVYQLLIAN